MTRINEDGTLMTEEQKKAKEEKAKEEKAQADAESDD